MPSLLFLLLAPAAFAMTVRSALKRYRRYLVRGQSMEPAFRDGDFLVLDTAAPARHVRRGQMVVHQHPLRPGFELLKRIERVTLDSFFVIGDNEGASSDSRQFGPVSKTLVVGRVVLRYWPVRRLAFYR